MQLLEKQKQSRVKSQLKSKVNLEAGGNIKITVENEQVLTTQESVLKVVPVGNEETNLGKSVSESSDTFETRLLKMSEEQKGKALEKYETTFNDFRFISIFLEELGRSRKFFWFQV